MKPIEQRHAWSWDSGLESVSYHEEQRIRDLLVGRSVTKVADDRLLLDDGTMLRIIPNEGCGGCPSGDYELTELNGVGNIITNVEFAVDGNEDRYGAFSGAYRIFVFADNQRINLVTVEGGDGNGYYGTGYKILVRWPE